MSEVKILTIVNLMDFNNDWIELDNRCDVSMIPIDNLISIVLERVKTGEKEISVHLYLHFNGSHLYTINCSNKALILVDPLSIKFLNHIMFIMIFAF